VLSRMALAVRLAQVGDGVTTSKTFDIADHAGGNAVPGSAGTVITSGACGINERAAAREGCG
jgi:hypothetical protein